MPGSGKDILVQTAKELGFSHIRMGDVVRSFAKVADITSDDMSIGAFATEQRQTHGGNVWALRTLDQIPKGNVIIDGSRSLVEIDQFRKTFGDNLVVVGIDAPTEERFRRLKRRGREDDPEIHEEFKTRDKREESWGLSKALESADRMLINDGGLAEFRQKCHETLSDLL
jgi:dephospho-CoA kinase